MWNCHRSTDKRYAGDNKKNNIIKMYRINKQINTGYSLTFDELLHFLDKFLPE